MANRENVIIDFKIGEGEKIIDFLFLGDRNGDHWIPIYAYNQEGKIIYDGLVEIDKENKEKLNSVLDKEYNFLGFEVMLNEPTTRANKFKTILKIIIKIEDITEEINIDIYSNTPVVGVKKGYTILQQKSIPEGLLETMVGKEESQVKKELDDLGFACETVSRDGVSYMITCDLRSDRARMEVKNGKVVDIWRA